MSESIDSAPLSAREVSELSEKYYNATIVERIDFNEDLVNGVIKSLSFGFVVTWIALFQGYDATPTSAGVSRATTRTVVHSSLAVLGLDFVLTALMFGE